MVNIDLHNRMFISILRSIYSDPILRTTLGFKGGTAALLFYNLPRFSVDLDFDLLNPDKKDEVFTRLKSLLPEFGDLIEATEKQNTLFFLLIYRKGERNLKIEISKRPFKSGYAAKSYLGISMLVMKEDDMVAGKLSALLTRNKFAARDIFDLWFFLKNNWQINEAVVREKTGLSVADALDQAQEKINAVKKTEFLAGLGDLLDNQQKNWVREKLSDETLFYLKLYRKSYK